MHHWPAVLIIELEVCFLVRSATVVLIMELLKSQIKATIFKNMGCISVTGAWVRPTVLRQTPSIPCGHYCWTHNMNLLLNQNTGQYSGNTTLLPKQCSISLQREFIRFVQHNSWSGTLQSLQHRLWKTYTYTASSNGAREGFSRALTVFRPTTHF